MVTFGGLVVKQLGAKLISMGCDGSNVFQGAKAGVTTWLCWFYQNGVWLFNWKPSCRLYMGFFFHSPKKFLEFQSLCDVFIKKGNKLLRNMKIRWINMLSLVKHVMEQYQLLIAKMHDDAMKNIITIENLSLLCDLELIFGLHAILLLLDCVHTLIKFAQSCKVFVCDYIDVVKIYQLGLYQLYNDPYNKFDDPAFDELKALETFTNKNLPMSWCAKLNGEEVDCLFIGFFGSKYFANQCCLVRRDVKPVLRSDFPKVLAHVKMLPSFWSMS